MWCSGLGRFIIFTNHSRALLKRAVSSSQLLFGAHSCVIQEARIRGFKVFAFGFSVLVSMEAIGSIGMPCSERLWIWPIGRQMSSILHNCPLALLFFALLCSLVSSGCFVRQ